MNVLLVAVNARYIHSNLAVHSLKAYGEQAGARIEVAEYTVNHAPGDMLRDLYLRQPDMVLFSCYIWNIRLILDFAADFRKISPVPVWAGGPEVSWDAGAVLEENPWIDGVLVGEGEETFLHLLEFYRGLEEKQHGPEALEAVRGLAIRQGGGIRFTGNRDLVDMDSLPFCYQDLTEFSNRILYYESSRGCPFSCSYCLSATERRLRFRSLELVKGELQFFLDHRVRQVKFVDRTFNCSHSRALAIWQYIRDHDQGVTNFHFEIAADLLTEEEVALLASMRPGLVQLEIGVQSANGAALAAVRRKTDLQLLFRRVRQLQERGNIHLHLDLIAGLPLEDYGSFARSFNQVYALKPLQLQLGFLKILKGSPLQGEAGEYGIACQGRPPYEVLGTGWLSYGELLRIKTVEDMLETYYNSSQFRASLEYLERFFPSAFGMFLALGDFYGERGYRDLRHSRIRRYEILLEFFEAGQLEESEARRSVGSETQQIEASKAQRVGETQMRQIAEFEAQQPADAAFFRELLAFDLYAREKCGAGAHWLCRETDRMPGWLRRENKGKNAHLELFSYDILGFLENGRIWKKETLLRFDYTCRSPLDHSAAVGELPVGRGGG